MVDSEKDAAVAKKLGTGGLGAQGGTESMCDGTGSPCVARDWTMPILMGREKILTLGELWLTVPLFYSL